MASEKEIWCPVRLVLEIIEGKWTAHIITELFRGKKRHTELAKRLVGINPKTLTDRLRDLEESGIVHRKMFEEIPPRVEYSLTARGKELAPVFAALKELGISWKGSGRTNAGKLPCLLCADWPEHDGDGHDGAGKVVRKKVKKKP